jgi:hypothetical protein
MVFYMHEGRRTELEAIEVPYDQLANEPDANRYILYARRRRTELERLAA